MSEPKYELEYWPIPFRGCFISYLFAYRGVALQEKSDFEGGRELLDRHPGDQDIPVMGLPVLRDLQTGRSVSQMPAIVQYVSAELDLLPKDRFDSAMSMKVLMDCNDLLMEICRYNGTSMWEYKDWKRFRSQRLVRWMQIFEESLVRGFVRSGPRSFGDIAVFALFGNMIRCLPDLEPDLAKHAPNTYAFCKEIGAHAPLASYVDSQTARYGNLYCGGQIEDSIRDMLERDAR